MYQSQITVRYAKSLFLLAKEKNKLEEIKNDIVLVNDTILKHDELNFLIDHPVVRPSEKNAVFTEIFKSSIDPITKGFLKMVIQNKRETYLKRIFLNFIEIYKRNKGINSAILTTAYNITNEEIINITLALEKKIKSTLELESKVDESIVGGFILQIGDKELDMSVFNQLQRFKNSLIEFDLNSKKKIKNT